MTKLTVADIEAAENNLLLSLANRKGWTSAEFFTWLNSKNGRWFGEMAFAHPASFVLARTERWNLMVLPRPE